MTKLLRRTLLAGLGAVAAAPALAAAADPRLTAAVDYVRGQKTTGFLVRQGGRTLVEENWAPGDAKFERNFTYGVAADGGLREDVASQQKSFVAVLLAIGMDKGLIEVDRPVSSYIGPGWSKASPAQEAAIRLIDVMTMSSGLKEDFSYAAPPGTAFFYNTPVYAISKQVVAAAARRPLDELTREWLTAPAGMSETGWRERPAAFAAVGNPTGLVTTPRDVARFGELVLAGGVAASGRRVVSARNLSSLFTRSATNPAYGRFWWLNGSAYAILPLARRVEHALVPAAPGDLVAALGALDRKLYVVPSMKVVVVRMGQACPDKDFDQQLWTRLMPALG